jgi:hypothetical protein
MPVTTIATGNVFSVRVYKRLVERPDRVWANTYEIRATGPNEDGPAGLSNAANGIAAWEAHFHLETVQFDRFVVSTWVPDGEPYAPDSFISSPLTTLLGERNLGEVEGDQAPLQVCFRARFVTEYGRNGRRLYRGVLGEGDFISPGGDPALTAAARAGLLDLMTDTGIATPLPEYLAANGFELVLASLVGGGIASRPVLSLSPDGVTIKKYNNRYFDRAGGPTPVPTP